MLGNFAFKALNFLFGVYVVRQLGGEHYGQYTIVLAFVGLFQIFSELGISQFVMRELSRDRSKTQKYFGNLIALRLLLALGGMIGIPVVAIIYGYSQQLALGVFIYASSFLLSAFEAPLRAVLTANERLDYVAASTTVGQLCFVILGAIFLYSELGFIWLIVASLISLLPQIGLALWAIRRYNFITGMLKVNPRTWSHLIRGGIPFGIITLTLVIASSIDTIMLSKSQPEHVVGWYNVAYKLIISIAFLTQGFKDAIVPSLSRTYVEDKETVQRWYYHSTKFILVFSIPVVIGGMLTAYPLIGFLYTDEFLPSAVALQILVWDIPFLMFAGFCGRMTTIVGFERAAARIYTINAIANVLLNLYAIPRYGLIGAAFVSVITDIVSALQFHFLLKQELNLQNVGNVIVRVAVASLGMGMIIWFARDLHVLILLALGVISYLGLAFALQVFGNTEKVFFLRIIRKFTGIRAGKDVTMQ